MPVDTSIYNNLLARPKSVAEYDADAQNAQMNRLTMQMSQAKMGEYQRGIQQENALADAYKGSIGADGAVDRNKLYSSVAGAGLGAKLPAMQKSFADADEAAGKVSKQKIDLIDAKLKQSREFLSTVKTPEEYLAWHQANHADPILGPALAARGVTAEQSRAAINTALQTPGGFEDLLKKSALGIEKFTELNKPTVHVQNLGSTSQVLSTPGLGGAPSVLSTTPIAQSPDSRATAATAAARLKFDKEQSAAENAPDTTTPEEKKLWLHTYTANNGQMPRSAPPSVRKYIGTWAAEMGITPSDLASGAAKTKFDQAVAVTAGHRGGAMASVEATMPALVENAQDLSHKLGQGKFVPLNKLVQMADDNISDPTLAAFKVAHMAVVSEYQQVISRGGTNVTALNEAMHVLNGARSVEAYDAAMNMVKKEVAINVAGTKAVRASMGGADHAPASAAPAPPPVARALPAGWTVEKH